MTERSDSEPESVKEVFASGLQHAVRGSGIGQLTPGEVPRAAALLRAVGGVRGLVESILPGLGFLVVYTITQQLVVSVLVPVAVSVSFVIVRLFTRSSPMLAIAGLVGVGISATLALFTGRVEDNFLPGLIINICSVAVLLISILSRWPLIGILVGLLANEHSTWRDDPAKRRIFFITTWLWVGLFALRLFLQWPLYLAEQTELLAATKLVMGVPLYAALVWVTWLLVRSVYPRPAGASPADAEGDTALK